MHTKILGFIWFITTASLVFCNLAHAAQYDNLAGSYSLLSDQLTKPDGSVFECAKNKNGRIFECKTVKGKIVIAPLPDKTYLYLEAYTAKAVGTMGNFGNYQVKQGKVIESTYTTSGLVCCSASLKQLMLEADTLTRNTEGPNFKRTTTWKRIGSAEIKDKYLERELKKQRSIYSSTQKK